MDRIDRLFAEGTEIDRAVQRGIRDALRRHKLLGEYVVVWRNGQVVRLPPEEIPDFEAEEHNGEGSNGQ